jgi:GNAT superfamily N-acetyltransferase
LAAEAVAEKADQKGGAVWTRREGHRRSLETFVGDAIAAADHEVVVGELDGVPVAYGVVHRVSLDDGGKLGVVDDIYVEPQARELGLGEALMDQMISWCQTSGCFGVDSLALPGDRSTKNFFESFGLVARAIVVHKKLAD